MSQVNGILGFIRVNRSYHFDYKELCITEGYQDSRDD